ncbi:MAG: hypothetical protein ABH878_03590 [bacterium]
MSAESLNPARMAGGVSYLLLKLGISPDVFRTLLQSYLLMDLRSSSFAQATNTKAKDSISPLFWVVAQYLLISVITCLYLYHRVDAYFFALINLGISIFVVVTSLIVEFHEVVMDPEDLKIIGHHPISPRTYAATRLTNLLGYVLLVSAALNIVPAISGIGLADAGWTFFPAYALAALLGNGIAVGLVILLYSLILGSSPAEKTKDILAWTQVALIMVLFYTGWMTIIRNPQNTIEMMAYHLPEWVHYLPVAWLAALVDSFNAYASSAPRWWMLAGFLLAAILIAGLAVLTLSRAYSRFEPGRSAWYSRDLPPLPSPGNLVSSLVQKIIPKRDEQAFFWLGCTMLNRDTNLKMRGLPQLAIIVTVVVIGLLTGLMRDPWNAAGGNSILSYLCIYLLAYPLPLMLHSFQYSRHAEGSWILKIVPIASFNSMRRGLFKAIIWRMFFPLFVGLTIVFAWHWGNPLHALLHTSIGILITLAAGFATLIWIGPFLPFSRPISRGETLGAVSLFASILSALALGLGWLHAYAIHFQYGFWIYLLFLIGMVMILRITAMAEPIRSQRNVD